MLAAGFTITLIAFAGKAFAQTKNEFSITQCVDYANKNNLQVKNALLTIKSQEAINKEVTASALPTINASVGGVNYLELPVSLLPGEIFGGTAGSFMVKYL
jgi:outer membrane protein TolC